METWLSLSPLGALIILILMDIFKPARAFPRVAAWRLKGVLALVLMVATGMLLPSVTDAWLGSHRLLDASGLGTWGGAALGLLTLQFFLYWWHRTMHRTSFLWRWFHQMHHSAERIDIFGAFYFHPLDMIGFTLLGSLVLVLGLGVTPEAAMVVNTCSLLLTMFQHANLRTPRWVGYFVQRPEGHLVHHGRGVHAFNYGDIALWDQVFGTFRNPVESDLPAHAGFYDGASKRIGPMLLGRDVSAPSIRKPPYDATSESRLGSVTHNAL